MEQERAAPESRVVILGASNKEDRYSFKAFNFLREREFVPVPVHPRIHEVGGVTVFPSLDDPGIREGGPVDTVTLYVNPAVVRDSLTVFERLAVKCRESAAQQRSKQPQCQTGEKRTKTQRRLRVCVTISASIPRASPVRKR